MKFTPIRVVCQNTLTMAVSEGRGIRIQHTKNLKERLAAARDALGIIEARLKDIAEGFRRLDAIWFGSGYLSKARAYRIALRSAEAWKN